jgi:hypothetical protein
MPAVTSSMKGMETLSKSQYTNSMNYSAFTTVEIGRYIP